MNKGVLIGIVFLYMVLIVYIATVMGLDADSNLIGTSFEDINEKIKVVDLIRTFFRMVRFNVDMPWVLNLFLIYPPIIIIVWHIIEILKDLVPFT